MNARLASLSLAVAGVASLVACGGGSSGPSTPAPVATPVPTAAVSASGNGYLVLHPSIYATWGYALETPVRVRETGGGTAKWNYARMSLFRGGREIERSEIGADILSAPPDWSNIAASSDVTRSLVFRLNSDDFDSVTVSLGFSDLKDARQFTADVPFSSFSGVNLSLTPMSAPEGGARKLP